MARRVRSHASARRIPARLATGETPSGPARQPLSGALDNSARQGAVSGPDSVTRERDPSDHTPVGRETPRSDRGVLADRGPESSSRGKRVAPHSVVYANCVLRVGGGDSTRSLSGIQLREMEIQSPSSRGVRVRPYSNGPIFTVVEDERGADPGQHGRCHHRRPGSR